MRRYQGSAPAFRPQAPDGPGAASPLRVVCAWCQRVIRAGSQPEPVSHGICDDCASTVNAA